MVCPPPPAAPNGGAACPHSKTRTRPDYGRAGLHLARRGIGRGDGGQIQRSDSEKEGLLPLLSLKKKCTQNTLKHAIIHFHLSMIIITSHTEQILQGKKKTKAHSGGLAANNYVTGQSVVLDMILQDQCLPIKKKCNFQSCQVSLLPHFAGTIRYFHPKYTVYVISRQNFWEICYFSIILHIK